MSDQKQLFIDLEQLLLSSNKMLFEVVSSAIRMGTEIYEKNKTITSCHERINELKREIEEMEENSEDASGSDYGEESYRD